MLQQVLWEKKKELERFALKVKKLSLKAAILIAADDTFLAFLDFYGIIEYGISSDSSVASQALYAHFCSRRKVCVIVTF